MPWRAKKGIKVKGSMKVFEGDPKPERVRLNKAKKPVSSKWFWININEKRFLILWRFRISNFLFDFFTKTVRLEMFLVKKVDLFGYCFSCKGHRRCWPMD
jgi:hypothetical protein